MGNAQENSSSVPDQTVILQWDDTHHDLGEIKKGEIRNTEFYFTNSGSEDIVIELVSACECSTLDWTRGPIQPGEKGIIEVIFDSSKKEDSETIDVDIYLENRDPISGDGLFETVTFSYILL